MNYKSFFETIDKVHKNNVDDAAGSRPAEQLYQGRF